MDKSCLHLFMTNLDLQVLNVRGMDVAYDIPVSTSVLVR